MNTRKLEQRGPLVKNTFELMNAERLEAPEGGEMRFEAKAVSSQTPSVIWVKSIRRSEQCNDCARYLTIGPLF